MTDTDNNDGSPASIRLDDIYFVLFRHKWMILLFSLAGIVAAAAVLVIKGAPYQSEAKLLVRYVQENRSMTPAEGDAQIRAPDIHGGETVINTELEILSSLDL